MKVALIPSGSFQPITNCPWSGSNLAMRTSGGSFPCCLPRTKSKTTRDLALVLGLQLRTVETYRARIKQRLGLADCSSGGLRAGMCFWVLPISPVKLKHPGAPALELLTHISASIPSSKSIPNRHASQVTHPPLTRPEPRLLPRPAAVSPEMLAGIGIVSSARGCNMHGHASREPDCQSSKTQSRPGSI